MRFLFLFIILVLNLYSFSQIRGYKLAAQQKISLSNYGKCVSYGLNNSVIVSGSFTGPYTDPDSTEMGGFVSSFDSQGNVEWSKEYYSPSGAIAVWSKIGTSGNIYVCTSKDLTCKLLKYDPQGNLLFSRPVGSAGFSTDMVIDKKENILITGYHHDTASFEGSKIVTNHFLAKYDADGSFLWVKNFYNENPYRDFDICLDEDNNIYTTGAYFKYAQLTPSVSLVSNTNTYDGYLAKFDSNANLLWVKNMEGSGSQLPRSISVDNKKNIFVGGVFDGQSTFGAINISGDLGYGDIFLARYDSSGACEWVRTAGSSKPDRLFDVYADNSGNVFCTGRFNTPTLSIEGHILNGDPNYMNMFLLQFYDGGKLVSAISSTGGGAEGLGLSGNSKGDLLITGDFGGDLKFGDLTVSGDNEMFAFKLNYSLDTFIDEVTAGSPRLKAYPNPTSGLINITGVAGLQESKITFSNILGQILAVPFTFSDGHVLPDFTNVGCGVYFVHIVIENEHLITKVIVN